MCIRDRLGIGRGGFFLGSRFVAFATIIGDVETAALEKKPGTRADFFGHRSTAPFFTAAKILGTDCQGRGGHGLRDLKFEAAFLADIFVGRDVYKRQRPDKPKDKYRE